jgi:dipeptidyl aminopeptidase/acylaminoacyl peptidase
LLAWLAVGTLALGGGAGAAAGQNDGSRTPSRGETGRARALGRMYKGSIEPHWFHGNNRFWYRNELAGDTSEFILVDAESGQRGPAFDHSRLAVALSAAAGAEFQASRLPFRQIEFIDDGAALRFEAAGRTWKCDLSNYACVPTEPAPTAAASADPAPNEPRRRRRRPPQSDGIEETPAERSPDGRWTAFIKDHNLFVKPTGPGEVEIQLSDDGREGLEYALASWSPDSTTLIAWRVSAAEEKLVHLIESSPPEGGRARLKSRPYALPGDPFPTYELNMYDVASRARTRPVVERFEHEWLRPRLRWNRAGTRFAYQQVDRGHQRLRVIEVEARTGVVRSLVEETASTFIWTAHTEEVALNRLTWMKNSDEAIYASERDGWRHLYLVDAAQGGIVAQITRGEYVVRGIERIDEERRQVWFTASGRVAGQDPYLRHHYRVNFDGSGLVALTEGDGDHALQFSPDRRFALDTWSRVDQPPAHTLRRMSDGALVCCLEEADVSELKSAGWAPPEVFSAKGRDGKTDIWGIIVRPPDFDPAKKHPVIEDIYAGPHGSFVPKTFHPGWRHEWLTRLGFIVVQIDGMGTANRSKAFHDVCWKNLKDAGFPDRLLWMKAAAAKHPEMDLNRVGIFGTSAGGQSAAGALLFHPEFYKAAVANCGCHDNRMDKASWNEQWMGYPVGPQYAESSNIDNAHRLQGKLFLIVGELDDNVPPESTLRLADALIRADKDFDLLVVPGGGHGAGGGYGRRRLQDFFVRHLTSVEPPHRNMSENNLQ